MTRAAEKLGARYACLAWLAFAALVARGAGAQDFAGALPPWPPQAPSDLLERGLPPRGRSSLVEIDGVRWFSLADLASRGCAVGSAFGPLRAACGLSQTGSEELGWTALGVALGAAYPMAGAAARMVARRDCRASLDPAVAPREGYEVGFGAWAEATRGLHVWTSVPQLWRDGAAPPLARGLELGVALAAQDLSVWLARTSAAGPPGGVAEHTLGLGLTVGPLGVWLAARDRPLRGTLGLGAAFKAVFVAAGVDGHPVLGETVRLSVGCLRSER